jgi:hypothetical protein
MYMAADALVLAEKKREFPMIDVAAETFAFVFFIFGVWWLQPRVNAFAEDRNDFELNVPLDQFDVEVK